MHVDLDSSHPCCPCTRKQMSSASHWHHSLAQHSAVIKNVLWFVNWIRSTSAFLVLWEDGAATGKTRAFHRSQDAPWNLMATERHWAGTHLALLPCQPRDWMRKPGPQELRQRHHLETTQVKTTRKLLQGEMETSKPCISVSQARRETRASLCTPKPAGQRMQSWVKQWTELAELLMDHARWSNPWVIQSNLQIFSPNQNSPRHNGL